jgi:hypothetical protein
MLARDDGLGRASRSKGKSLDGRRHQANALLWVINDRFAPQADVRFGSEADMCAAKRHVCFTPNSDRESGFPQKVMSALPLKADIHGHAKVRGVRICRRCFERLAG